MKKIYIFLISLILALSISTGVRADFFTDVIVTSSNGIWTDARAYGSLTSAVNAVGSVNQRTIVIASPQNVGNITIASNITLKFERDGAINNSGQLTINTKNIIAPSRQIFTGSGDIDFASGTELNSKWFSTFERALTVTSDDTVSLLVSSAYTITSTVALGDDVTLRWEAPGNILTVNTGFTVSNIGQVTAGNYQLFAGAGNFRFRDGTNLNSSWFAHMRSIITWVSTNRVTLTLQDTLTVDNSDIVPTNIHIDVDSQRGLLSLSPGITLTINSVILAGPYQWFIGTGTVVLPNVPFHYPEWYSSGTYTKATIDAALSYIGTVNKTTLLIRPTTWVINANADWSAYTNVTFKIVPGTIISHGTYSVKVPMVEAGPYQIYNGTGIIYHPAGSKVDVRWYGLPTGGDDKTIIQNILTGAAYSLITFPKNNYSCSNAIYPISGTHIYFEPGTVFSNPTVVTIPTPATNGPLFYMVDLTDVIIDAYGAEFKYTTKPTADEYRHIFGIFGCTNVKIFGAKASNSGGDGFAISGSIGVGGVNTYSQDIILRDCWAYNNRRGGIGITSVKGLTVDNCKATNTDGTSPEFGIAVEPNDETAILQDIVINNPNTYANSGFGIYFAFSQLDGTSEPVSATINSPIDDGSLYSLAFSSCAADARGKIHVNSLKSYNAVNGGIFTGKWYATGVSVTVADPYIFNCATSGYSIGGGVIFYVDGVTTSAIGNIHIIRPVITASTATNPYGIYIVDANPAVNGFDNISIIDPVEIDIAVPSSNHQLSLARGTITNFNISDKYKVLSLTPNADTGLSATMWRTNVSSSAFTANHYINLSSSYPNGTEITFAAEEVTSTRQIQIKPTAGVSIVPLCPVAASYIWANDYGSTITLKKMSDTIWKIVNQTGYWFCSDNTHKKIYQSAPTDKADEAPTLTIANLLGGLIKGTPTAARAYTLPTGTDTDAGAGMVISEAFDWNIVNLAATTHTITLTASSGHSIVGNAVVTANSSATWRTWKTAVGTFVTYRIN